MKVSSTPAPDLVTDSYPLDNNATTDLLEHQRPRTESAIFNQLVSRIPSGNSNQHTSSPPMWRNSDPTWREVNGDWRHQINPLNSHDLGNHGDTLWFDADQMDVPLLTSSAVSSYT